MTLYELTEEYKLLQEMCYDPEVDEQTLADTMEGLEGEFETKADGYAKIITGMKSDIERLRAEETRLAARRKSLERRSGILKDKLEFNMREIGKKKFKTALFSFFIQKIGGPASLILDGSIDDVPDRYLIPQPPVLDTKKVRELLEKEPVTWAHLEPRGESLRIR